VLLSQVCVQVETLSLLFYFGGELIFNLFDFVFFLYHDYDNCDDDELEMGG